MIKLNEQEMDEAIDRAIEKFCDDYVPLYDGPRDEGYVVPYYAKSTLRSLCIRLIAELCGAEVEKVKGEYSELEDFFIEEVDEKKVKRNAGIVCNPDEAKCPRCGHTGIKWDEAKEWYCPSCGNYLD